MQDGETYTRGEFERTSIIRFVIIPKELLKEIVMEMIRFK